MLTWKLWEQLQSPPINHPLFHQVQRHATPQIRFWKWRVLIIFGLFTVFLINPNLFVPVLLIILLGFPLLSSTLNGIIHTLDVTQQLIQHKQDGTASLLGVTPHGTWGSYWAIATGILYQNGNLRQQYRQIQHLIWIVTLGGLIFILANGLLPNSQSGEDSLNIAIVALLWSGLLWINAIQSMILSSLIGLVIGSNTRTLFDGQMVSIASFISLQLLSYGSVILLIAYLPLLIDGLNLPHPIPTIIVATCAFALFLGIRELAIRLLMILLRQSSIDRSDSRT